LPTREAGLLEAELEGSYRARESEWHMLLLEMLHQICEHIELFALGRPGLGVQKLVDPSESRLMVRLASNLLHTAHAHAPS
jgi:hypothetical protein